MSEFRYKYPKEVYVTSDYEENEKFDEDDDYAELTIESEVNQLDDGEVAIYKLEGIVNKKTEVKLEKKVEKK